MHLLAATSQIVAVCASQFLLTRFWSIQKTFKYYLGRDQKYTRQCLVLLQVAKCFVPVQTFCVGPLSNQICFNYLHTVKNHMSFRAYLVTILKAFFYPNYLLMWTSFYAQSGRKVNVLLWTLYGFWTADQILFIFVCSTNSAETF